VQKTANKISLLVESQLPDFINEDYELFGKFIKKYYEQLEIQGQPLDIINNLQTYRDIDFYEKNVLKQSTTTSAFCQFTSDTITVVDARSFPEYGGYIKINDEICFYGSRTDTEFLEVSRGVSGNTTLGDLYETSKFVTTQAEDHASGSIVQNISNLFLYALIKSFETQYLSDFPEAYLNGDIDKRTLIKNISSFYQSKGTDNSIKFLFKCLINDDPNPEVAYPRDHTIKASESNWISSYSLKVKVISGTVEDLIGQKIEQSGDTYASAIVDNVRYSGKYDGEDLYEIILSESNVNGEFSIANKTKLTKNVLSAFGSGDRVDVFSTMGWKPKGEFFIDGETFSFEDRNVNQFVIKTRSGAGAYSTGSLVTSGVNVSGSGVKLLIYGVLYNLDNIADVPYSNPGDRIDISDAGFLTNDVKIFDEHNNLRWNVGGAVSIGGVSLNSNVSAIYEDIDSYYITSSGFPSHTIGTLPADAQDQKNLKIIRKNPISVTESYETQYRDVGIAVNGIPFLSYKDDEVVFNGAIQKIAVNTRGLGYTQDPFILINGVSDLARTKRAGQVVESVIVDNPGDYTSIPTVEILSGRNGTGDAVVTNGEITSITIINAGEYYSSPPEVRITDLAGKGRFADYVAVVSNEGAITGFTKITGGKNYTQSNVRVDLIPAGSGATATATIKEWRKDKYNSNKTNLDGDNGYFFQNYIPSKGHGYGYYASPTTLRVNDTGTTHSPIIGFAYDGNPIYGAYGHSDPLDANSSITRMTSSYSIVTERIGGPPESTYPIGTFINDYEYEHDRGYLDKNNGRFCITPEFPQGTYAYFITVSTVNTPVFPYLVGVNYYSLPVDSNYNSEISQYDLPINARRLRTSDINKNGDSTFLQIQEVSRGSVSSATILRSGDNFSVGSQLVIDDTDTSGYGARAEVDSVKGITVSKIESQVDKVLFIYLSETAYLFDGDTVTQGLSQGKIVGNIFSGSNFAIRGVTGTWSNTGTLTSSTQVLSLVLSQNASYTKGAILSLNDGVNSAVATGQVLETTTSQNTVKVKVTLAGFIVSNTLFLSSSDLLNTPGSKIFAINSLSENLGISSIQDNVALLSTTTNHGVGEGETIDIDINPDNTTDTTYHIRSCIYQEATLETPVIARVLNDSGIGRFEILNGGDKYTPGTYADIALSGGNGSGAKANFKVEDVVVDGVHYFPVTEVALTNRGTGYKTHDILTIGDTDLAKTDLIDPRFVVRIDHAGFASQENKLIVDSAIGFNIDDFLKIGNEILKIVSISGNEITVLRGQDGTTVADHSNGVSVNYHDPGYVLNAGYQINQDPVDPTQPIIVSYDKSTQKVIFKYDYDETLTTITPLTLSTVFKDESTPTNRVINVNSITTPKFCFEFSTDQNGVYIRNPIIDIKKYYKYKFDLSHTSMISKKFDISPSINLNLVTEEKTIDGNIVDFRIGFGPRIKTNPEIKKVDVLYTKYYYYDNNNIVDSEVSYFNVTDDPIQGTKKTLYVTPDKIMYPTGVKATHDGSGSMSYITTSIFSVGEINSVKVTNIGNDYKRIPIVTGIYNSLGSIDKDVDCYLNSKDIGIPRNITISNNGGSYHNDKTLSSTFRSNYFFTVSDFKKFSVGETVIQRSGTTEVARATVTSWRSGSNVLVVNNVKGIFREDKEIIGLAKSNTATLRKISFTEFSPIIKTYYDNIGYYNSDLGKISDSNQRIHDSYYYQDYSYLIKSKTPMDTWRQLIKETTHPAGFKLFGEVLIDSSADVRMSEASKVSRVSVIELGNKKKPQIVSVASTKRQITQSIVLLNNLNVEKGVGSVSLDAINDSEISAGNVTLSTAFDGALTNKGNLQGTTQFTLVDSNGDVVKPYNNQSLIVTLDGILQEPGVAYTISEDKITFAHPPLTDVTFYGRKFSFKDDTLNAKYLKKIRNIFQRNGMWIDAANQLERNREYIQKTTLTYIKTVHPTLSWTLLGNTCYRDIGLMVDALAHDLRFGGNEKVTTSVELYFNNGVLDFIDGELEPTLEAFEYAVGLAKKAMKNELSGGYVDSDILADSGPTKCEDVESALDTLYEVARVILTTGPGSVSIGHPDYIDGENKIFDLYYEDGTEVVTQVNEDLFITLSGVLQHKNAYVIDRTSVPNKVIFDQPPIWGQGENTKTVYEPLAVEKFFAFGIGSYNRCFINNSAVGAGSSGPFLIVDGNNDVQPLAKPEFALVFIDGVLQREGSSYVINGPAIKFTRNIYKGNNVELILLYGRDTDTALTFYDYQQGEYFNNITLTCIGSNPTDFNLWKSWYNTTNDFFQVAYQKIGGVKKFIGNVKSYTTDGNNLLIILSGNNPDTDTSDLFFASKADFSDEYQLTGKSFTVNIGVMQRNSAKWLYGTKKAEESFYEQSRGSAKLLPGDIIKVDGEDSYRTINKLPSTVIPKTYNPGAEVSNNFFGYVTVSNYSGLTRGVGLSVSCEVSGGNVTSITWNKTDLQLFYEQGILRPSEAKNYDSTPILHFIPVDGAGGGARAEVKVSDGHIVDIILTDAGSGYTQPPKVITTRQYDLIKQRGRKIDSLIKLRIEDEVVNNNLAVFSTITPIKGIEGGGPGGGPPGGGLPPGYDLGNEYLPATMNMAIKTSPSKEKITTFLNITMWYGAYGKPRPIPQEINRYWPTVVESVTVPDVGNRTSQGTSILELGAYQANLGFSSFLAGEPGSRPPGPQLPPGGGGGGGGGGGSGIGSTTYQIGFVDHRGFVNPPPLENMTMRPAFFQWEGAKFMSTGDILSPAGNSVSEYTIEEFDRYGFNLLQFSAYPGSGWSDSGHSFNIGYPTINNYLTQLDTSDLPDENGAGYVATGAVVYANTTNFPSTGTISIGKEKISYTSKLSDRFIGCTRGVDGTSIELHIVGALMRNAQ